MFNQNAVSVLSILWITLVWAKKTRWHHSEPLRWIIFAWQRPWISETQTRNLDPKATANISKWSYHTCEWLKLFDSIQSINMSCTFAGISGWWQSSSARWLPRSTCLSRSTPYTKVITAPPNRRPHTQFNSPSPNRHWLNRSYAADTWPHLPTTHWQQTVLTQQTHLTQAHTSLALLPL